MVLAVTVAVFLKSSGIGFKNPGLPSQTGSQQQISIDATASEIALDTREHALICVYHGDIVECTLDAVNGINGDGTVKWTIPVTMSSPFVKISESDLLVADSGGRYLCCINDGRKKWELTVQGPIINADISDKGYAAIVQEVPGYKCRVSVVDPSGAEVFNRSFAENYVLQALPAASGRYLIVNSIDASGLFSVSNLEFFNMKGDPFSALIPEKDKVYPYTFMLSGDNTVSVGDNGIVLYDSERKEKWRKDSLNIGSVTALAGKYIVIASIVTSGHSATQLTSLDMKGENAFNLTLEGRMTGLRSFGTIIAAFGDRDVYFISSTGRIISKYTCRTMIKDVLFIDRTQVVIVTQGRLFIIKI